MNAVRRSLMFTKLNSDIMSEFRYINGVTLTEEAELITISLDTNGNSFNLKDYYIEACIMNKNADNADLSGWKVSRLYCDRDSYFRYTGSDAVGNLPAINQSQYLWCYGLNLGNDGSNDCYMLEAYTGPYNNGSGATFLFPRIYKSNRDRNSVTLTTACTGWKLGVGSFLKVYGRE